MIAAASGKILGAAMACGLSKEDRLAFEKKAIAAYTAKGPTSQEMIDNTHIFSGALDIQARKQNAGAGEDCSDVMKAYKQANFELDNH